VNIVVNGLLTNYQLQGKGKLVLLLHGWGDSSKGLADLQIALGKTYQVLALDLPGFGGSQPPKKAWNLDDYADFLAAVLKKLELKQPYAIVGHSNGGAVAIRAVGQDKLRPQKLVLLAASGIRHKHGARKAVLRAVAKTGKLATARLPGRFRQALRQSLYTAAGSDLLVVPGMEGTFKRTVAQDVQADAASIDEPTLLIFGEQDKAVPPADGERYHQLLVNSQLEVLQGVGHFVHLEQPTQVAKRIQDFL